MGEGSRESAIILGKLEVLLGANLPIENKCHTAVHH